MILLTLLSQKGGAGKTSLAIHLAGCALHHGLKTALIDTDPQHSLAFWAQRRTLSSPTVWVTPLAKLQNTILHAQSMDYHLLILDTPPLLNSLVRNVAKLSHFFLLPSRPALLDLHALDQSLAFISSFNRPAALVLNACPPVRSNLSSLSIAHEARLWLHDCPFPLYPSQLSLRAPFSHALINGQTILEFQPHGKAALEILNFFNWLYPLFPSKGELSA